MRERNETKNGACFCLFVLMEGKQVHSIHIVAPISIQMNMIGFELSPPLNASFSVQVIGMNKLKLQQLEVH